jgi:hypothetical protein
MGTSQQSQIRANNMGYRVFTMVGIAHPTTSISIYPNVECPNSLISARKLLLLVHSNIFLIHYHTMQSTSSTHHFFIPAKLDYENGPSDSQQLSIALRHIKEGNILAGKDILRYLADQKGNVEAQDYLTKIEANPKDNLNIEIESLASTK